MEQVDTDTNSPDRACGGVPDDEFPNFSYGAGRLNACRAVKHASPAAGLQDCER